jgi:flagellar biosynthesis protein FlhG
LVSFGRDQAAGLRRMVADPKPRMLTILSAASREDKNVLVINLAAAMERQGSDVLLLDACGGPGGVAARLGMPPGASLLGALHGQNGFDQVAHRCGQGFDIALLAGASASAAGRSDALGPAYVRLANKSDVMITDVELGADGALPLVEMEAGEIIVQVSSNSASIQAAYTLIKQLNAHLGRRPFGIVVSGAAGEDVHKVFAAMAQTASRYLALELRLAGAIPADECLRKSARLERPVVDAFPMSAAAVAFRRLAGQFSASAGMPAAPPKTAGIVPNGAANGVINSAANSAPDNAEEMAERLSARSSRLAVAGA